MTGHLRLGFGRLVLGMPIGLLLGLFFALPILSMFSLSLRHFDANTLAASGFTPDNFGRFLGDGFYVTMLGRTTGIALAVTAASVLLGYPVAWHLHATTSPRKRALLTLVVLLPLTLSLVVASFAWVTILGSNGVVNGLMVGSGLVGSPVAFLNTDLGVVAVTTYSHVSYAVLTIYAALENVDPAVVRAARIHGASGPGTFLRVILPLSFPGVVAGAVIVFTLSMAAFVVPYLIGGGRVKVVALLIYQFTIQLFDWSGASALAVILFALTFVATWAFATLALRLMPWERGH